MTLTEQSGIVLPPYRYDLKARIITTGFKSMTDFSQVTNIKLPIISQIIRGWIMPGLSVQKRMAQTLGITLKDLRKLL